MTARRDRHPPSDFVTPNTSIIETTRRANTWTMAPRPPKVKKGSPPPIDKLLVPAIVVGVAMLAYQFFKGLSAEVSNAVEGCQPLVMRTRSSDFASAVANRYLGSMFLTNLNCEKFSSERGVLANPTLSSATRRSQRVRSVPSSRMPPTMAVLRQNSGLWIATMFFHPRKSLSLRDSVLT